MLLVSPPEQPGASLSRLEYYHREMMECLRSIKATVNPSGRISDPELWRWMPQSRRSLASLVAEYEQCMSSMFEWDPGEMPGWEKLETWIDSANQLHRLRMDYCHRVATISGQDADEDTSIDGLRQGFLSSPAHQMIRRTYGPHWQTEFEGILRSYGSSSTSLSQLIPLEKCRDLVELRTSEILRKWELLKTRKKDGTLDEFLRRWAMLNHDAQLSWLRSQTNVWDVPHQDIYAWTERSNGSWSKIDTKQFFTSLLNAEDFSRTDWLGQFLQSRVEIHPQLFREADSKAIPFGLFAEAIPPLRCEGRMVFPNFEQVDELYEVNLEQAVDANWTALDPCNGLLSLEAQTRTYQFCLDCTPDRLPERDSPCSTSHSVREEECRTLLDRCSELDMRGPDKIDLAYIGDLLRTSLDEAQDDLWQLRQDEEHWLQRCKETKASGCTSSILTAAFERMSCFTGLCELVNKAIQLVRNDQGLLVVQDVTDARVLQAIGEIEAGLFSTQNAVLSSLTLLQRIRVTQKGPLTRLLALLMDNSPIARVMDIGRMIRVIDREIRIHDQANEKIPLSSTLVRSINDLAVLSFCLDQVCKHYLFKTSMGSEHFQNCNEMEKKWEDRPKPWTELVKRCVGNIDHDTLRKLDVLACRENVPLKERHSRFWMTIDQHMHLVGTQDELFTEALRTLRRMRAPAWCSQEASVSHAWPSAANTDTPSTQTATRKGKRRAQSIISAPEVEAATSDNRVEEDVRPVIPVPMGSKRAWNFWRDLIEGGPECRKEFRWHDLVMSMAEIGYAHEATTGSVYRFEYQYTSQRHAINFHKPSNNVLNARQARAQWRDRIARKIRLELIED